MTESGLNVTWTDLFNQGTLCDLDVSVWAGLVRVKPEDLGIEKTDAVAKALTFGHERLVSKGKLQPIRTQEHEARKALDAFSITFPLIEGSRYVPRARHSELEAKLTEIKVKFDEAVVKFIEDYDEHRVKMRETLRTAIRDAAKDPSVVETTLRRIEGKYPSHETLREKFNLTWRWFSVAAPQDGTVNGQGSIVDETIGEMVGKLRQEIDAKMGDVIDLCVRGGKLSMKTYNSARTCLDRLESLNVFGDQGLARAITRMRETVSRAIDAGPDNASEVLVGGLNPVREELSNSVEEAVAQAAKRLTGGGKRKLSL